MIRLTLKEKRPEGTVLYADEVVTILRSVRMEDENGKVIFERREGGEFRHRALWVDKAYEIVVGTDNTGQQIIVFKRRR